MPDVSLHLPCDLNGDNLAISSALNDGMMQPPVKYDITTTVYVWKCGSMYKGVRFIKIIMNVP